MARKKESPTALDGAAGLSNRDDSTTESGAKSHKGGGKRTRNYAYIFYPESAPENWRDRLSELGVPCIVSPLHDKDKNPDGSPKEEHYHAMFMFSGVKTYQQVLNVVGWLNGVAHVEPVNDTRSMARYFCHLDNPSKAQYSTDDVLCFGGADYLELIASASDKYRAIAEMEEFCDEQGIDSYRDLCRYARKERPDWHRLLCTCCSVHMTAYLKSASWTDSRKA